MNIRTMLALVAGLLLSTAGADTKTWKTSGATDYANWTDANNFEGGAPQAGDTVSIPADVTVCLNASDTASCALATTLDRIQPEAASSKLVVTVNASDPNDGVLSLGCKIAHEKATNEFSNERNFGEVVKKGNGELYLTDGSDRYYYYTSFTVDEGSLRMPQNCNSSGERFYNRLSVASGAMIFTVAGDCRDVYCRSLTGAGIVTNDYASFTYVRLNVCGGTVSATNRIEATLAPKVYLKVWDYVELANSANVHAQGTQVLNGGHVSYSFMGASSGVPSSFGTSGYVEIGAKGGHLHYRGAGETTSKSISINGGGKDNTGIVEIDAGSAYLAFNSSSAWMPYYGIVNMVLSGMGQAVSAMDGAVRYYDRESPPEGKAAMTITKSGSGVWRLGDNIDRSGICGIYVAEGTLQIDSLREKGTTCSIGTSTANYPYNYYGYADTDGSRLVDYALAIGGLNGAEGTLAYTGSSGVWVTDRPMIILGDSRLVNNGINADLANGPSFRLAGIASRAAGDHKLTLDGNGAQECAIGNIVQDQGRIKLVKEGTGTWSLVGTNAFTAGVEVKAGTLKVADPQAKYTWFKWVMKETFQQFYDDGGDPELVCSEFALYDKDGNRVNSGLTRAGTDTTSGFESLQPGQVALVARYKPVGKYAKNIGDPSYLFNNLVVYDLVCCLYPSSREQPSASDPATWQTFVMRLPTGAAEVASYDVAMRPAIKRAPRVWELFGSTDGVNWDSLDKQEFTAAIPTSGSWNAWWMLAGENYNVDGSAVTHTGGRPIAGAPVAGTMPLALSEQDYIKVAHGAALVCAGTAANVKELRIDAADGLGTIAGLTMDAAGTLVVTGADTTQKQLSFPADLSGVLGLDNLSGWKVVVNGSETTKYVVRANANGVTLAKKGMIIFFR